MSSNTTAENALDYMKETIKISVYTPIIYVGIMMTAFIMFSINHRKRRLEKLIKIKPLFPENTCANLYMIVKQMSLHPDLPELQKPGNDVLKAALLRRAGEAIKRSMKLKEFEPAFEKLYHDGLIGDDIYKEHGIQSKMQEMELQEIVVEANQLKADWVNTFFPVAQEICFNEAMRRRFYAMDERARGFTKQWNLQPPIGVAGVLDIKTNKSSSDSLVSHTEFTPQNSTSSEAEKVSIVQNKLKNNLDSDIRPKSDTRANKSSKSPGKCSKNLEKRKRK